MPISLTCTCGKQLRLKDEAAGKKGKCPACGAIFQIPAAGGSAPAAHERPTPPATPRVAEPRAPDSNRLGVKVSRPPSSKIIVGAGPCPGCNAPLAKGAVMCVRCGYDVRTGSKKRSTVSGSSRRKKAPDSESAKLSGPGSMTLTPVTDDDMRTHRMYYVYGIMIACALGAAIAASIVGFVAIGDIWQGFVIDNTTADYKEYDRVMAALPWEYVKLAVCLIGGTAGGGVLAKIISPLLPR
jgi:hypothetical protein